MNNFIETPMVTDLFNTLKSWIRAGFTGGLIVGDARLGKSWALRSFIDKFETSDGEAIKVFYVSFAQRDKETVRSVYFQLARRMGFTDIKKTATADDLEDLISVAFADAAMINKQGYVGLIVDEAQELTLDQLSVFAELFNKQDEVNNHLMVFFIANTQRIKTLTKELLQKENEYLRERFFYNLYKFYGIRTLSELRECLDGFERLCLSTDANKSLVEFHCERMVNDHVHLVDLADSMWDVYQTEYATPLALTSWGMTYFQRAMLILVQDYIPSHWKNDDRVIRVLISKSIAASGINPTLKAA